MAVFSRYTCFVLACILLVLIGVQADTDTAETVNSLARRLDAVEATNSNLQTEVATLKENMALLVTDSNTGLSINVTALKEDVLMAVSSQLHLQWSTLNRRIKELENQATEEPKNMTEMIARVDGNREMFGYLNEELCKIRSDIKDLNSQQTSLATTLETHMSSYIQQIQNTVNGREKCQTGVVKVDFDPQLPAATTRPVQFERPFLETPVMSWGVMVMDAHRDFNLRFNIIVTDVSKSGFTFRAHSWADTILYSYAISWIACPM